MIPKHISNDTGDSDMLKRICKVLPLSEKVKVFDLRKKWYDAVTNTYSKQISCIHKIVKKEKEIHTGFAFTTQPAEVTVPVHGKYLVKMKNTLNFYNKIFWESRRETTFR